MSKLGVRKDQQQNQERGLKTAANDMRYDGPRESALGSIGRIGSSSARLDDMRARHQAALADKCSNPTCGNASDRNLKLSECGSCHSTRYCGRECQLAHWG